MALAEPSPVDDEDFLLFLADSIEDQTGTVDPLSMVQMKETDTTQIEQADNSQNVTTQQEDKK